MFPGQPIAFSRRCLFRTLLTTLGATAALLMVPGLAMAASASLSLRDAGGSGIGADVFLTDGPEPGQVSITLDSVGSEKVVPDLLGLQLTHEVSFLPPRLTATGPDVHAAYGWPKITDSDVPCPCNLLVNLGASEIFELTGLTSTSFALSHPTEEVTLSAFDGAQVLVILGLNEALFDDDEGDEGFAALSRITPSTNGSVADDGPGFEIDGVRVLKLEGTISVIPEPSTALLMTLGLMGLAVRRERR